MPWGIQPDRVGSLVLGAYDVSPEEAARHSRTQLLICAGRVGIGFHGRTLALLQRILVPVRIEYSPLDVGGPLGQAYFVRPKLVCEIGFREWTDGGELRHPSFHRLLTGIRPENVTREAWLRTLPAGRGPARRLT